MSELASEPTNDCPICGVSLVRGQGRGPKGRTIELKCVRGHYHETRCGWDREVTMHGGYRWAYSLLARRETREAIQAQIARVALSLRDAMMRA